MTTIPPQAHAAEIIDRIYEATGTSGPAELARALDLSDRSVVSNWKRRGTVPLSECLRLAEESRVSLDWLLLGRGPVRLAAVEYQQEEDRPDGRRWVNDGDHDQAHQDPADLAAIIAWARAWHASATPDERAWLRVQLRRAVPELAVYLDARLGTQDAIAAPEPGTGVA